MKKYLLGLSVVAIALFAAAFTTVKKEQKTDLFNNWFVYKGPLPATDNDLKDESNYEQGSIEPCDDVVTICAVNVPGSGTNPDPFTTTIEEDILDAQHNHAPVTGYILMRE